MPAKFTVIDEEFVCVICGEKIPPLGYTARNHCRKCLHSLHLDVNPGDRQSDCGGVLCPVAVELNSKKAKYVIIHKCSRCGMLRKNITADDDDYEVIVNLSAKTAKELPPVK